MHNLFVSFESKNKVFQGVGPALNPGVFDFKPSWLRYIAVTKTQAILM